MGNKRVKKWERRIHASIDTNVANSFYRIIKRQRWIINRAIEGAIRYWIKLPVKEQIKFLGQEQQLVSANMAVSRRIVSTVHVRVEHEFRQQSRVRGIFMRCAFEAAIRAWMILPVEKQAESIIREKNTITGD